MPEMVFVSTTAETLDLAQLVVQHCSNTAVLIDEEARCCIDGRYDLKHSRSLKRPGADFKDVMLLLAVNAREGFGFTPEECFDIIYHDAISRGRAFYMHTDHHTAPPHDAMHHTPQPLLLSGCGHIARATEIEHEKLYGAPARDTKRALLYAWQKKSQGAGIEEVNLPGEHEEVAVLINKGTRRTIAHQYGGHMFFVYDDRIDHIYTEKLVLRLRVPGLTVAKFFEASAQQVQATMHLLASGKRLFEFNVDGDQTIMHEAGVAL
jgi:hypothetical protein